MGIEMRDYDVVVAGGGTAGIAAAISASREGAKVALMESHSYLGGKATASNVGTVCGLFLRNEQQKLRYASNGFPKEFGDRLQKKSNTSVQYNKDGLWYLPYQPFEFKRLCDELMRENNVDLYLHSVICDAEQTERQISRLGVFAYDRLVSLKPTQVIDCTGEATVSKLLGHQVVECNEYQSAAQVFTMEGVTEEEPGVLNLTLIRAIKKALESGHLDASYENITLVPGSKIGSSVSIKIGIPEPVTGSLNKITPLELMAREMIEKVAVFLISHVNGFRNAGIAGIAPEVGIRTGRRPMGCKELELSAVLKAVKCNDGIANGSWPIEEWKPGSRVKMDYFAVDDYYQVPAGCLQSMYCDNLYFAGRHISASNEAIASARVIGTCLATGYAAGRLAAGALAKEEKGMTIQKIREAQVFI